MTKKMWGGRFAEAAAAEVEAYTQSEGFDRALYREDIATFEKDSVYQQADATGFIRLNSLRLRVQSMAKRKFNG